MKYLRLLFLMLAAVVLSAVVSGCEDDFRPGDPEHFIEGTATLEVTVGYDLETEVDLLSRATPSGGDKGNSINAINSLVMVAYNTDGTLYDKYVVVGTNVHKDITSVDFHGLADNRLPDEVVGGNQDKSTGKVTYKMRIAAGRYHFYAVANMGDLAEYDISTPDKLKSITRTWEDDITANCEMFGIYSQVSNRQADDLKPTVVSADLTQLHCWVRRLASKVTVAFDGTGLYDDVQVYIETVKLKDIPRTCTLGYENTPGKQDDGTYMPHTTENMQALLRDGATLTYQTLPESKELLVPQNFLHVCNGKHPYFGKGDEGDDAAIVDKAHENTNEHSLFFYENCQGIGKSKKQSQDGKNIDFPNPVPGDTTSGWKDHKPFGTYVEVVGYYRFVGRGEKMDQGKIIYRFMLGQDVDRDYNATRNAHYKLTLCFKGYGNDADWHIEFPREPGITVISPQYISYLYNKKTLATVRVSGQIDPEHPFLYAAIVGSDDEPGDFPMTGIDRSEEGAADKTYWRPWGDGTSSFPSVTITGLKEQVTRTTKNDGPWNSFLSLRVAELVCIQDPEFPNAASRETDYFTKYNETYWKAENRGWRRYSLDEGDHPEADGTYIVENMSANGDDRMITLPLYTRAKELITKTGFTGNNPYTSYPRKMKVRFSVSLINPTTGKAEVKHAYLNMVQVERIENPKAVWRNTTSDDFHVILTTRPGEYSGDFAKVISRGKWCAEVYSGDNIVTLTTTPEGSGTNKTQHKQMRIEGEGEHPVDFFINFNGSPGFAIVRVRYNNYTCEHDIFVRKSDGTRYSDVQMVPGGGEWSSYNVLRFNGKTPVLTDSPLEQGSFFRRGSYTAIRETNDTRKGFGPGEKPGTSTFQCFAPGASESNSNITWGNLAASKTEKLTGAALNTQIADWPIEGGSHIATIEDFYELCAPDDNQTGEFHINKAYGIIYGDGATETQLTEAMATGYSREEGKTSLKGMRGVIVYNSDDSHHIFLPIGMTGFGRRKANSGWLKEGDGVLRYATRYEPNTTANMAYTPLFYDLYLRPGAIYWCQKRRTLDVITHKDASGNVVYRKNEDGSWSLDANGKKQAVTYTNIRQSSSFDINYYSMGFEGFENNSALSADGSDSDACFIRTVK